MKSLFPLGMGFLSAVMCIAPVLSLVFLIPLQIARVRAGMRAFVISAITAFASIIGLFVFILINAEMFSGGMLILSLSSFAATCFGLVLLNSPLLHSRPFLDRLLIFGSASALLFIPSLVVLTFDPVIMGRFAEIMMQLFPDSLKATSSEMEIMYRLGLRGVYAFFAVVNVVMLYINYSFGTRFSGKADAAEHFMPGIATAAMNRSLIWPLLLSWGTIMFNGFVLHNPLVEALAGNIALLLAFGYLIQGLSIAAHLVRLLFPSPFFRLLLPVFFLFLALNPTALAIVLGLIALLGMTETWVPFRTFKGVNHEGNPEP